MADKPKPVDTPSCNPSTSTNVDGAALFPPAKPGKPVNYGTNNTLELLERIPTQIVDLRLDEVLTAVKTVDNLCDYPRCKTKTSLMGQDCELCKKRYCFKHGLPEVHGCGVEKKREERKEFLNPKPIKTVRQEQELKNAKKKLDEKLKNMQVGRMQKAGSGAGAGFAQIAALQSKSILNLNNLGLKWISLRNAVCYTQGQSPEPRIREYFYYIDHEGMLFLDDAKMKNFTSCFKEKKFLKFFFNRLRLNETQRYQMFPYMSPCGRERNYIRCDDTPIVFTEHLKNDGIGNNDVLIYAHGGPELSVEFKPSKLYMHPKSGRVYHPAWPKVGGIALVRSKLAIELSQNFVFVDGDESPTYFHWNGAKIKLEHDWIMHCQRYGISDN